MTALVQNPTPRHQLAKLLSDYSDKKLSGDEFVNAVVDVRYKKDENLDLVVGWIFDTFEPEFGKPGFDIDNPPFAVRRQLALFRRFLLSGEPYRWPANAGGSDLGCLRLLVTGVACSVALLAWAFAKFEWWGAVVSLLSATFAAWMIYRERHACERDWHRAQDHARQFGDPEMWPFLTAKDFRRVGPSRLFRVQE